MLHGSVESPHLDLARRVAQDLLEERGDDILAVGIMGSVALGETSQFSDIDMIVITRRRDPEGWQQRIVDGILVSGLQMTREEAERSVTTPNLDLPEILSGWRSVLPIHDPDGILARLKEEAGSVPMELFRKSSRLALLTTVEDLGKLRDALEAGRLDEAREMSIWYTGSAITALANILGHVPRSGKTLAQDVRRLSPIGEDLWRLRTQPVEAETMRRLAEGTWAAILRAAEESGITVEDLR